MMDRPTPPVLPLAFSDATVVEFYRTLAAIERAERRRQLVAASIGSLALGLALRRVVRHA